MPLKEILLNLARYIVMTGIGMLAYAVTFRNYQKNVGITDYQGLNQVGLPLGNLMEILTKIKDETILFFFESFITDSPINLFEVLNVFLVILILLGLALTIYINKIYFSPIKLMLVISAVVLLLLSRTLYILFRLVLITIC